MSERESNIVPEETYKLILAHMPFPCVDIIVATENGVLLVWRDNEPAKDQWWLPGGRVFKGETLEECALRKAREEVNLECSFKRLVHVEETIFETGPWNIPVHTVNVCALLEPIDDRIPVLDNMHSKIWWLKSLDELPLHDYVLNGIRAAQVL